MAVYLSSSRYRGSFTKTIRVSTNDPEHPNEALTCRGRVLQPLDLNPKQVNFGQIRRSSPTQNRVITILRGDGGPIAPEVSLGTKLEGFYAQVCEIEPGEHYELEVSAGPPWSRGRFRETLKLKTGVEEAPSMTVYVTGQVAQRLTAIPNRLTFPLKRAEESEESVLLRWDSNEPANILEATTTIPGADVRIDQQQPSRQRLVVTVPAGSERIIGSHSVTLKTDDPEMPIFSVPVTFRVERGVRGAQTLRETPPGEAGRAPN